MRKCSLHTCYFLYAPILSTIGKVEWVEMNIVQDVKQMSIIYNRNSLGASLKQCSTAGISLIKIFCISHVQFHQKPSESFRHTLGEEQVIMVVHNAPPVNIHEFFPRSHR